MIGIRLSREYIVKLRRDSVQSLMCVTVKMREAETGNERRWAWSTRCDFLLTPANLTTHKTTANTPHLFLLPRTPSALPSVPSLSFFTSSSIKVLCLFFLFPVLVLPFFFACGNKRNEIQNATWNSYETWEDWGGRFHNNYITNTYLFHINITNAAATDSDYKYDWE